MNVTFAKYYYFKINFKSVDEFNGFILFKQVV